MPTCAELLARSRAVVCDFDGTLVDSNGIKRQAFEACFPPGLAQREAILAYCGGHHHTPRGEKFRHVYERILRRPYTADVAAELEARFDQATTEPIIAAAEIPGAERFLQALQPRRPAALLSSTPQQMLLRILAGRGWLAYFACVQGAPVQKALWLKAFGQQQGLKRSDILVFGDTPEDAAAAREAGCAFVAVGQGLETAGDAAIADFMGLV